MEIEKLLVLLSPDRATHLTMWHDIGQCLYNISTGYLDHWKSFTKICGGKFDDEAHDQAWLTMEKTNHGMATLHVLAMNDNPEGYVATIEKKFKKQMKFVVGDISTFEVAELVLIKYPTRFKCASIRKNQWYEFKNHRWHEMEETYTIRMIMSNELVSEYEKLQLHYFDLAKDKSGYEKERYLDIAFRIYKVINKLHQTVFKNKVIKQLADLTYDPIFLKNLNENTSLICFEDGVYDLNSKTFRNGQPDDYISFSTGYKFLHTINDNTILNEIVEYIGNFGENVASKLIKILNDCVRGSVESTDLNVLYGPCACGKTMFIWLIKYLLGDYYKYVENFTIGANKFQRPSYSKPFLNYYKGIRFCYLDERYNDQKIHTSMIKTLKETIKHEYDFNPQFRCFTTSNVLPQVYANEPPTKNIQFEKKITEELRINNLNEKMKKWAPTLMHLILSNWKHIKDN